MVEAFARMWTGWFSSSMCDLDHAVVTFGRSGREGTERAGS